LKQKQNEIELKKKQNEIAEKINAKPVFPERTN